MRLPLFVLAGATVLAGGCTETLVVDATGNDIPPAGVYASPIGGADGIVSPGEELRGKVLRVETSTTTNRFAFLDNDVFRIEDDTGTQMVQGTYEVRGDNVCVDWIPRGSECWPQILGVTAVPVTITSNRGQTIQVSLIDS